MVPILLMTDTFRGNTKVSRWRDPAWLAWLAVPLYWVHQFEEYSLPVLGFDYSIQEMICQKIGFPPYPACPIPLAFYPVVNIALMWFGALTGCVPFQAQRPHWPQLLGLLFANGLVHTFGGITEGAYNTGLWSAAFLFIPLSIWVLYAATIRGPYSGKVVAVSFVCGAVTHALLFIGYGFFKSGITRQRRPAG